MKAFTLSLVSAVCAVLFASVALPALAQPNNAASGAMPKAIQPDLRLGVSFDVEYLTNLRSKQPAVLERMNYFLDYSYELRDIPKEKLQSANLPIVRIADVSHINIYLLIREQSLKREWESPMYYRIEGTDRMLMLLSEKEFSRRFNEATGRTAKQ